MPPEQQAFDFVTDPGPPADAWVEIDGSRLPAYFRRNPRARHYLLYLRRDRTLRVTLPLRGTVKDAQEFVQSRKGWIRKQLTKIGAGVLPARGWLPGDRVPIHGEEHPLTVEAHGSHHVVRCGPLSIQAKPGQANLRPLVEAGLKHYAARFLPGRVRELADAQGWQPKRISVRNQSTRWGSCSERGTISLNWRLVQVPPEVCDYVILHELCHLDHLNHAPAFWNALAHVCPRHRDHQQWLRSNAVRLGL